MQGLKQQLQDSKCLNVKGRQGNANSRRCDDLSRGSPEGYVPVGSPPRRMSRIPGLSRSPTSVDHQDQVLVVSLGHHGTTVFTIRSFNNKLGSPSPHKVSRPLHTELEGPMTSTSELGHAKTQGDPCKGQEQSVSLSLGVS